MIPGMNKKMLEKAMKQLGMKQENIEASEVIIKGRKTLVIKNPEVIKVDMMGQETFQITGNVEEAFNEDDIKIVMEQANVDKEEAIKALQDNNGNIAEAILSLKQ